jgi:hypothetical protein
MLSFVISQMLGLLLFVAFNWSIYLYLKYKRSQLLGTPSLLSIWKYRIAYFALAVFFMAGTAHRTFNMLYEIDTQIQNRARKPSVYQTHF